MKTHAENFPKWSFSHNLSCNYNHKFANVILVFLKLHDRVTQYFRKFPFDNLAKFELSSVLLKITDAHITKLTHNMMKLSNGNIFHVTDPLCGEFTGHRWIPLTKASGAELWCFLLSVYEQMVEQARRRWFETLSHSLWCHCNEFICTHTFVDLVTAKSVWRQNGISVHVNHYTMHNFPQCMIQHRPDRTFACKFQLRFQIKLNHVDNKRNESYSRCKKHQN